jgi:predicted nucleotidyltransferase
VGVVEAIQLAVPKDALAQFCQQHGIMRLSLFGSVLRDDFSAGSDVDVLADFEPGTRVTFFTLSRVEEGLSSLLGRRVDLHLPRSLSPYLRARVLAQAREVYVAA